MVVSDSQAPQSPRPMITNCNAISPNYAIIRYPLGQGLHPFSTAPQAALLQSARIAQAPISSFMEAPTSSFDIDLEQEDMEFLKRKWATAMRSWRIPCLRKGTTMRMCTFSQIARKSYVKAPRCPCPSLCENNCRRTVMSDRQIRLGDSWQGISGMESTSRRMQVVLHPQLCPRGI